MIYSSIKRFSFYFVSILVVLANFFQPFTYLFVLISIWHLWKHAKYIMDINIVFLFIFAIAYDLATNTGGVVGRTVSALMPISFFIIGKFLTRKIKGEHEIIGLLFSFIFIFNAIPLFSYLFNVINFGFDFSNLHLLGFDNDSIAFTNFCSYFSYNVSLFPVIYFKTRTNSDKLIKRSGILFMLTAIIIIGSIGQRTGFAILLISLIVYVITSMNKNFLRTIFISLCIGTFIFILLLLSFNWISETTLYERLFVSDTDLGIIRTRSDIWEIAINEFMMNPSGNKEFTILDGGFSYAHNLWLDVGLRSGYVVLLFLIIVTVLYFSNLAEIYKKSACIENRMIFVFLSIAIFATFMVEPIMQGYTHFFWSFAFIFGVMGGVRTFFGLKKL